LKYLKIIDRAIESFCKYSLCLLFIMIIIAGFMQVFWRYALNNPLTWSDELCRYGMIWLTFIGAGLGVKRYSHITIDILKGYLPESVNAKIERLNSLFILVFSLVIIYFGAIIAFQNMNQFSPGLYIPMGTIYLVMPIGGLIMLFYSSLQLFQLQKKI